MCSASVFGTNRYEYFKNVGGLSHAPRFSRARSKVASDISRYARNVQRLPQVMFRTVKSGYCSGFIGLSAQLNYVLSKADRVIDPGGDFDGADHMADKDSQGLASRWADNWQKTAQDGKHTMHLVASFPHGTPEGAVECILRDTCEELLSQGRNRFEYIAAIHTDTNNPHGHIIVNRRNGDGEWFYLARDGEFTYDLFKDTLVKHAHTYGVELNNSSRLSRGLGDYALDSNPKAAMRGLEGTVLDFGAAAYKHEEKGSDSFYVTLQTCFGERTIWGVGLASVLGDCGAMRGDAIRIRHEGKKPVEVRGQDGTIITTHRNDWRIDFAGVEYGAFDRPEAEAPTKKERAAADQRRGLVLREAGHYRRLTNFCKGTQIALGLMFQAASEALHNGQTIDELSHVQEDIMSEDINLSEADIARERAALFASIDKARDQLKAVWEHLPNISDTERPQIEDRYFKVVDDMDRLFVGERRREFIDKAEGSVYADEHRFKLARQIPARSFQRLDQYGISRDEFVARTNIEACSYALESHWNERDVAAVAQHLNVDVHSEEGRAAALSETAELHGAIIEDLNEAEILHDIRDLARQNHLTLEGSHTLIDDLNEVLGEEGMRDLQNANPDVFRKAGFEIDEREALSIAQSYCDAMSQYGYVMDASIQAIVREQELLVLNEKIAILEHDRELGDKAMEEELNERESYGL
ncbi:relaxase/mobilization nuclease domain-containing protein [Brucella pseudogrignonensis]